MKLPEIDRSKMDEVMELIDKAAGLLRSYCLERTPELDKIEIRLRELTGNPDLDAEEFAEYSDWTSLEDLAETVLMPIPTKTGLSDEELSEIIGKVYRNELKESETDYFLKVLEAETGLDDISDYIYYPDEAMLDMDVDVSEITAKILKNRK